MVAGAKSAAELARHYAAADVFVLPSLVDVWGLVVNEAMCFGLPILASQYAGAAQSLISGEIGIVFNPLDIEEFTSRLRAWAENPPIPAPKHCRQVLGHVAFSQSIAAIQKMVTGLASAGCE